MDESLTQGGDDTGPEVVDENRSFVLALSDAGWGVWNRGRLTGDPIVLYPPDGDGFVLAQEDFARRSRAERIRRSPWLDVLRWSALLTAVVWVVTTSIFVFRITTIPNIAIDPAADPYESIKWVQAVAQICQPLFLACLGAYVILWLRARQHV